MYKDFFLNASKNSGADKTNGAANAVKINKIKYSLDQSYGDVLYYSILGTDK